jgi:hypothetical protein
MPVARSLTPYIASYVLGALLHFFGAVETIQAEELLSPDSQSLRFSSTLDFDGRADKVLIAKDGSTGYIIENQPKAGTARLSVINLSPYAVKTTIVIEHLVSAAAFDPEKSGRLFVAGKAGSDNAGIMVLTDRNETASYVTYGRGGEIALAPDHQGGVYAADSSSNSVLRIGPDDFLPFAEALAAYKSRTAETNIVSLPDIGGVKELALSSDDAILFVSDSKRPQIAAFNLNMKGIEVSRIGSPLAKEGELPPLNFALTFRASRRAVSGNVSSLYVVDVRQRRLQLLDYNETVSTFDGVADASLGTVAANEPVRQTANASGNLIGVNESQAVILLGNIQQSSLDLYSRSGSTLQQLFAVGLPDTPRDIALSADGKRALVLLRSGKIAMLEEQIGDANPVPANNVPIGDELTRSIQYRLDRLGFSVGAIDGMVGARTESAVRDAIAKLGLNPSLSLKDPELLLRALEGTKSAY